MNANSFGSLLKFTTAGESHSRGYTIIIEGVPAGLKFDFELLQKNLARRKPGQSSVTTARQEDDQPEILSGVFEGQTLGTPIGLVVYNTNQKSEDYADIKNNPRIGHADDTWTAKYGHVDYRGGGRASGRETLARVVAGSVAQMLAQKLCPQLQIKSFASQIASYQLSNDEISKVFNSETNTSFIDSFKTRFPSSKENEVVQLLEKAKADGESYGGIVETVIQGLPAGLGQPLFRKLKSDFAWATLSLGATTGFEFGEGFKAVNQKGTDFHKANTSDVYGGLRGGLSTGADIHFRVAFKPTSSIKDVAKKGRHDPCIVPRAVPVVEAMAWFVVAEHLLQSRLDRI